jgi:DNA-binding CsgD family transcriptional regulator
MSATSELLLELHQGGRDVSVEAFHDWALAAVKERLPFDAALWATGAMADSGPVVHGMHLHRRPPELLADYMPLWRDDNLLAALLASPGTSIKMSHPDFPSEAVQEYLEKWDLGHFLSTVVDDPATRLFSVISLYRSRRAPAYSEAERLLKQDVAPHLIEAWRANRIAHLGQARERGARPTYAAALCDRQGLLHLSDNAFAALLRREWPAWRGPEVPAALLPFLQRALTGKRDEAAEPAYGAASAYVGESLVAKFERRADQAFIRLRAKGDYDRLAPRERQIARLFGAGHSQKEIAKALSLAPSTVSNHLAIVYMKLGIRDKAQLAMQVARFEDI